MIKTKTIIKVLICTILFVGLFGLNVVPKSNNISNETHGQILSVGFQFGERVLAQATTPATPPATGGTTSDKDKAQVAAKNMQLILDKVTAASLVVNKIFNPMIHFLTFKIGAFMGNDYVLAGSMGEMLHNIWVINRNIVNIVFVLLLLYMAVMHIIKEGEDTKTVEKLRNFAILLIAVNFSWLAGKMVLDASNVAFNVVLAIPSGISTESLDAMLAKSPCKVNEPNNGDITGACVPVPEKVWLPMDVETIVNIPDNGDVKGTGDTSGKLCDEQFTKDMNDGYKAQYESSTPSDPKGISKKANICWRQVKMSDYNQNTVSYYLTYSMARAQSLVKNTATNAPQAIIGTLFTLALQVVYMTGFLCLMIVLIFRAGALWILMAFSPFIVLLMYKDVNLKGTTGEAGSFLSVEGFLKWAFVPAKIGAVWTVGFIMVTAGQSMESGGSAWWDSVGSHLYGANTLFMGMSSIQQFIWFLITIGIIWMGTFASFKNLEFASAVTDKIKGTVKDLSITGARAVGEKIPLFPVSDGKGGTKPMTLTGAYDQAIQARLDLAAKAHPHGTPDAGDVSSKLRAMKPADVRSLASAETREEILKVIKSSTNLSENQITSNPKVFEDFINGLQDLTKEQKQRKIEIVLKQKTTYAAVSAPVQPAGEDRGGSAAVTEVRDTDTSAAGTVSRPPSQ